MQGFANILHFILFYHRNKPAIHLPVFIDQTPPINYYLITPLISIILQRFEFIKCLDDNGIVNRSNGFPPPRE